MVDSGKGSEEEIKDALFTKDLKKIEIESIVRLAKEFSFLTEKLNALHTTKAGRAFERYVAAVDTLVTESDSKPSIDRGTELKLCITAPPMWARKLNGKFGDIIAHTQYGQKLVAEDTEERLTIITPFLDVGIMQVALKDVYSKNAELIIITSEPSLVKTYPGGINFRLQKIADIIKSRFKTGSVFYLNQDNSIVHAKVWCSDRSLFVTSANVKPDSTTDNLEIGVYTDDPELVSTMRNLVDYIIKMEGINCLLKIL